MVFHKPLAALAMLLQGISAFGIDYTAAPPNLTTLFNNTLFYTWRPKAHSPQLDRALSSQENTWYNIISGGVHGLGPSLFLFRQYDADFRDWEYLGELWHEQANSSWGDGTWAGRWGYNFEVGNIFGLDEDGYNAEGEIFTTTGAEWSEEPIIPQVSQFREMLWTAHTLDTSSNGSVSLVATMAGKLDWGAFAYAAAGKILPANSSASQASGVFHDRFITYLWLTGDNFGTSDFPKAQQGWDGSLTTVRELSVGTISGVVNNDLVNETGSWRFSNSSDSTASTVELTTLKQTIAREVYAKIVSNAERTFVEPACNVVNGSGVEAFQQSPISKFFMLTTTIRFPSSARTSGVKAGLRILGSEHEHTDIYYQFSNESMIVDRSNSSAAAATTPGILANNEAGRFRLFDIATGAGNGSSIEALNLTIIVDNSIVEVYANGRFALSTWVWSWYEESTQISFFYEEADGVQYDNTTVYEGLFDAWPLRSY